MLLLALLLLSPNVSELVQPLAGDSIDLRAVCMRESRCKLIGVHSIDSRYSERVYRKAVAAGYLDPRCQQLSDGNWSTRGQHGMMAAYTLHHSGLKCLPPWVLDVPLFSAVLASLRASGKQCSRVKACRRWRG